MTLDREDLFPRVDSRLAVGGVPVEVLAGEFGTPLYVFDANRIRSAIRSLRDGFGDRQPRLFYSIKAWANVALLQLLRELDVGVDACSPGDLAFAAAAGYSMDAVSFCGQGLTDDEIALVARSGAVFVAGSIDQLERFAARRPNAQVAVRVNCGIQAGFHAAVQAGVTTAKFGVPVDRFAQVMEVSRRLDARVVGLHGHIGSDVAGPEPYVELLDRLLELAVRHRLDLEFVDLGGGFGVPFTADDPFFDFAALGAALGARLEGFEREGAGRVELRLEPGAFLVREAGYLLTRVCEVEPSLSTGPRLLSVDTSVNHLPGAAAFGAAHPVRVAHRTPGAPAMFTIGGNLMLAGDILRRDVELPTPVPGDVVVFALCGAYTGVRSSAFNERPRPPEVLIDAGVPRLVRRGETVEDLLIGQVSASHPSR